MNHSSSWKVVKIIHPHWQSRGAVCSSLLRVDDRMMVYCVEWLSANDVLVMWPDYGAERFSLVGDYLVCSDILDGSIWRLKPDINQTEFLNVCTVNWIKESDARRPYLAVVRCGSSPDFTKWYNPSRSRQWDVFLSCYADLPQELLLLCEHATVGGFSKMQSIKAAFDARPHLFLNYRGIALIDDDVIFKYTDMDIMFSMIDGYGFDLLQPSLTHDSFVSYQETLWNPCFLFRKTNFVEVMAPFFSQDAFQKLVPTFSVSYSSWGMDFLWPSVLGRGARVGIIDAVQARHSKPINEGSGAFYSLLKEFGIDHREELRRLSSMFRFDREIRFSGAVMRDGTALTAV